MVAIVSADETNVAILPAATILQISMQIHATRDVAAIVHAVLLVEIDLLELVVLRQLIVVTTVRLLLPVLA